jgi:HAE1 family hydrophobic/amphiphilic exporter-1
MRIWLDPNKLQARGLMPLDIIQAIQQQSQQVTAGQVGAPPTPPGQAFQYTLNVNGRLDDAGQFEDIIVKTGSNGDVTRVRDVGSVQLGAQTYSQVFSLNKQPSTGIAIFQSPGANALEVEQAVEKKMTELARGFPQGVKYETPFDTTKFVAASIHEVYKTLIEAGLLVLIVILVFLQDWRAMLVPATTVPVTIIGAFAGMALLGFTINLSTLFAIVLAIGIVVDDAIVVVEGAAHNIELGMSGHDAAIKAMDQLFGPIIGITLVLISVFLPAAFLPGLTGRMYSQFALVIAATALLSAINAATLKPTQCALWLRRPVPPAQRNWFYRGFNNVYDRFERRYARAIGSLTRHANMSVVVALILIGIGFYGLSRVPTGFLPIEDQGYLIAAVQLPDGAALERTQHVLERVSEIVGQSPGVAQVITIAGISALDSSASLANAGVAYIILKDWDARGPGEDLRSLVVGLNQKVGSILEARALVLPPPPIQGIGNAAGFAMQVELRDGNADYNKLQAITGALVANAQTQSALQRVQSPFRATVPQYDVEVDRIKTQTLHVTTDQVFSTLSSYLGSSYINQFNKFGRVFQVYAQADSQFRLTPRDIANMMVRNQNATVVGLPAQGYSSGQSLNLMEQVADKTLPAGTGFEWTAMSYQEKAVSNEIYYVFGLAMLLVYLVLAGQYESWYAPISVILAVPLSLLGPMSVLTALKIDNNLYVQIGLILLIALSAKNAILIVEVGLELHVRDGKPLIESAVEAARARFRPILMTSFAFILGVLPLVLASGAGASARKSIGITVFSGMLASTCLAVLFVPAFFVVVQRFENWRAAKKTTPTAKPVSQAAP